MVKKTEERKIEERNDVHEEKKDVFKLWADSYMGTSKLWEDSYKKLYKPWLESTGELFEKAAAFPKDATPKQYKEFYDEWVKTFQNKFGDLYPIPTVQSNKETLEKLLLSAEESNKLYRSWIIRLEENSRKTREILQGEQDPAKYKEVYDQWIKSYGKIFDELLELPARENIKEAFENYTGVPDFYSETFLRISKLWKNSYAKLYEPWTASISKLSEKAAEISKGSASPEAYEQFYTLWLDTYQETYGKMFDFQSPPSKEVFENFTQTANIYLNLYKSWIAALEKMSEKAEELSKRTIDPEASKEFYNVWVKTYERAFDSFFEDTPAVGPMKEIFEPVKNAAKIYADTFTKFSNTWVKSYPFSTCAT
jgi:hypothetical protein